MSNDFTESITMDDCVNLKFDTNLYIKQKVYHQTIHGVSEFYFLMLEGGGGNRV